MNCSWGGTASIKSISPSYLWSLSCASTLYIRPRSALLCKCFSMNHSLNLRPLSLFSTWSKVLEEQNHKRERNATEWIKYGWSHFIKIMRSRRNYYQQKRSWSWKRTLKKARRRRKLKNDYSLLVLVSVLHLVLVVYRY